MSSMSLLPLLLSLDNPRPSQLLDQQFGHGLNPAELMVPRDSLALLRYGPYYRPWTSAVAQKDSGSTVSVDKDKYQVHLDVQQFTPEEITVKVSDENVITIEGKHEEKEDEHGFISRHFVRKYLVPKGHDLDKIETKLSSDGMLNIIVPKKVTEESNHRTIPITQTGKPMKKIENKKAEKAEEGK